MTSAYGGIPGSVRALVGIERQLASTLSAASDEIAHSECLDVEQRAEVYAILEAIQADSEAHRKAISLICHRIAETGDA